MIITKISVQRIVVSGYVTNYINAYSDDGYRVGREQKYQQDTPLTDGEVRRSVNGGATAKITRESLGPATGRW